MSTSPNPVLEPKRYGFVRILSPHSVSDPAYVEYNRQVLVDEAEKALGHIPWDLEVTGPVLHDDKPVDEETFAEFSRVMDYESYEQYLEEFVPSPYYTMSWTWVGVAKGDEEKAA